MVLKVKLGPAATATRRSVGKPGWQSGKRRGLGFFLGCLVAFGILGGIGGWSQGRTSGEGGSGTDSSGVEDNQAAQPSSDPLSQWMGMTVRRISFEGVSVDRLAPLPGHLAQAEAAPLNREELKRSLRQLFSTGLFETIEVQGVREEDGVALIFRGTPRTFIGTVSVDGAKGATINTQLERASQLAAGTRFTQAKLDHALDQMRATLAQNGFHQPVITQTLTAHPEEQLIDIAFLVVSGQQARVGTVEVTGDPGMSVEEFRRHARLRAGSLVDHETGSRALAGVLKVYKGEQRLEAEIKLESDEYDAQARRVNFRFSANQGPVVKVQVEGAPISPDHLMRLIPIFEEGSVDEDLLNEGNRGLRDYYQRLGYFDAKVEHEFQSKSADRVVIFYHVQLGSRRRVQRVSVAGNHYFDAATLTQMLSVHAADSVDRTGAYSQALVSADINALQAVYQNNGFSKVRITAETSASEAAELPAGSSAPLGGKIAPFTDV
jgi:outer membrane protein insertion porin family